MHNFIVPFITYYYRIINCSQYEAMPFYYPMFYWAGFSSISGNTFFLKRRPSTPRLF